MRRFARTLSLLILSLCLGGCASIHSRHIASQMQRPTDCEAFLDELDRQVKKAEARDASSFPLPGFPYLRTNRFLAAQKEHLHNDSQREQWVGLMQSLDLEARKKEIARLPQDSVSGQDRPGNHLASRQALFARVVSCSDRLLRHDQARADFFPTLYPLVRVPDEYSFGLQIAGAYPLSVIPVALLTERVQKRMKEQYDAPEASLAVEGRLTFFAPGSETPLQKSEIREMLHASRNNPLGIPLPGEAQEKRLAAHFAPVYIQDVAAPYDSIGSISRAENRLWVDGAKPAVYYYISHAFLDGQPIIQINYVIWYTQRAGEKAPWIERGAFDGLTARVSLDRDGNIFMFDMMNNCGCYHFFAPALERVLHVIPRPCAIDPFVPQWLPEIPTGKRLGIRVNSGWHQAERLLPVCAPGDSVGYELVSYDVLEAVPGVKDPAVSLFNSKGIVEGSERIEPFILFPMGVPSIGSMRQRGHHAIEFTIRSHFDDPYLFEKNFAFRQGSTPVPENRDQAFETVPLF